VSRRTIVAGNWKLNPPREDGVRLYQEVCDGLSARPTIPDRVRVVIFPPHPYLGALPHGPDKPLFLGAQDVATESWGAFTGEVGAALLADFGVSYVLVGHSERRHVFGETDRLTGQKVRAAAAAGLVPILCVGETEPERDGGETFEVVERQLLAGLEDLGGSQEFALAYEPVWAIGTGRTATPEMVAEVHRFLRNRLESKLESGKSAEVSILYGGSVKPDNATALLNEPDIDGALVGGASLTAASFLAILDSALGSVNEPGQPTAARRVE
jgi:triosephosphate isomerase